MAKGISLGGPRKEREPVISLEELDDRIKNGMPFDRGRVPVYRSDKIATRGMGREAENIDPEDRRKRMAALTVREPS